MLQYDQDLLKAFELRNNRNLQDALNLFRRLSYEFSTKSKPLFMLGVCLYEIKDFHAALPVFTEGIKISPSHELMSLGLFHSLWEGGHWHEAQAEAERFTELTGMDTYKEILSDLSIQSD